MNYDKEPDQVAVDLDDVFNNAKTTLKQTKRNQLLKAKRGQRSQEESYDGYSEAEKTESRKPASLFRTPIPHIDDLDEGYQDAF